MNGILVLLLQHNFGILVFSPNVLINASSLAMLAGVVPALEVNAYKKYVCSLDCGH
jgi:hypothetical protein